MNNYPFIQQIGIELHIMCQLLFQGLGNQPGEDRNYITLGFTTVFTSPFITSPLGGRYNQFCVAGKEQRAQENSWPAQGLKASKWQTCNYSNVCLMLSFLFFTQQQHGYKEKRKQTFKAVLSSVPNERHSSWILSLFSLAWDHCRLIWGRRLLGRLRKWVHRKYRNPQREDALGEGSSYKREVLSTQSLWRVWLFRDPMDCSPPGSSVHRITQARMLEWVAIFFSRGSSPPRNWTQVSCLTGTFFITAPCGRKGAHQSLRKECTRLVWGTLTRCFQLEQRQSVRKGRGNSTGRWHWITEYLLMLRLGVWTWLCKMMRNQWGTTDEREIWRIQCSK